MIFTITALSTRVRKLTQEGEPYFRRDSRNVGYYFNLESAKKALTDLPDIMFRSSAEYVVIEAFEEGIFPTTTQGEWFVWNDLSQKFDPCEKPSDLAQTCNFGLG